MKVKRFVKSLNLGEICSESFLYAIEQLYDAYEVINNEGIFTELTCEITDGNFERYELDIYGKRNETHEEKSCRLMNEVNAEAEEREIFERLSKKFNKL